MNKQGNVFLFSGPSGSGKDTILKEVRKRYPDLQFSISTTSRPWREPSDDVKYNLVSKETFEQGIAQNAFLEYAEYCGNYYGTPAAPIAAWQDQGYDVIIECEVQGALQIMKAMPQVVSIFITPPSVAVLRKRLTGRNTESAEKTEQRIQTAIGEIQQAEAYQYLVVNDALEDAVNLVCSIIETHRASMKRNTNTIHEVLKNA